MRTLFKNEGAFTGLEAAIVLTAFIVVAAVFAYVVLGAGFFTTQKSKEVVHTGVEQATSSVELAGGIIATAWNGTAADAGYPPTDTTNHTTPYTEIRTITVYVQLTAGDNPVDLDYSAIVVSYFDEDSMADDLYTADDGDVTNFSIASDNLAVDSALTWIIRDSDVDPEETDDDILETGEKASITVNVTAHNLPINTPFKLEIKPKQGATLSIERTVPGVLEQVMDLL